MLWTIDTIQQLLDLYFEQRVLWDPKQSNYTDKTAREKAIQNIADNLGIPNVTAEDVNRKYRSMRAAYRVQVRNINTAQVRGFFYKPTLYWFDIFHQHATKIEEIKMDECNVPKQLILQGGLTDGNQYVFTLKDDAKTMGRVNKNLPPEVHLVQTGRADQEMDEEMEEESAEEVYSSEEESEDEFQSFANHIAEQLRTMTVHRAVMIQNQIQRIFTNDREIHEEYQVSDAHSQEEIQLFD